MLINKTTNEQVWEHDFRAQFPEVSFPEVLTDSVIGDFGFAVLHSADRPTASQTQKIVDNGVVENGGVYSIDWQVVDLDVFEIANFETSIRAQRDALLAETDWTQVKDVADEVSVVWAGYRQALRDVPLQAEFPFAVSWPVKPV